MVGRTTLRSLKLTVNGRTRSLAPSARSATVHMHGLPATIVQVSVVGVTKAGRKLDTTRRYRTCTVRKPGPGLPTLRLR